MVPVRSEATQPELRSVLPIRLDSLEVTDPSTSGPLVLAVYVATMVLARLRGTLLIMPPPWWAAVLPVMVQLISVVVAILETPPSSEVTQRAFLQRQHRRP